MHTIIYCTVATDNLLVYGNFNKFKTGNGNCNTKEIMEDFGGNLKNDCGFIKTCFM